MSTDDQGMESHGKSWVLAPGLHLKAEIACDGIFIVVAADLLISLLPHPLLNVHWDLKSTPRAKFT
jgi:hypothetical protein